MKDILSVINQNAKTIVETVGQESIDVYLFLRDQFLQSDVKQNHLFQFVFRSFYRLDHAGLRPEFKNRYFELMQENRSSDHFDVCRVAKELYEFENHKNQKTLQFSFITKMASMIDPDKPIYDSEIAKVYHFRPPYNNKAFDLRLEEYLKFYQELAESYQTMINSQALAPILVIFDRQFANASKLPLIKKLDFIVWGAGKTISEKRPPKLSV